MTGKGLSANQLKLIALVSMTVDHIGVLLFPENLLLRCIGRLAFPIYAYMLAEGCRHTRNMTRHFWTVAVFALAVQVVYSAAMATLYQCILVAFSLSIGLIWLLQNAQSKKTARAWCAFGGGVAAVLFITEGLPLLLRGTDFYVDYGFLGVLLPVGVYLGRTKQEQLGIAAVILLALSARLGAMQALGLLSVGLLALYNGTRGRYKLKYLFYIYHPAHLVVLWGIGQYLLK